MKTFTIVSNKIKDKDFQIANSVQDFLIKKEPTVKVHICEMEHCKENILPGTECILVLGGDGTLLRVAKDTMEMEIPLLGINLGTLGFLAEVEQTGIEQAMEKLLADDFHIESRMMLAGKVKDMEISALNDIVLTRRGDLQVIGYRIYVNGLYLKDFFADGIIVSTPTGSTGYNMSAGGSIVEPLANLMVLTPVCSHSLNNRSIMLSCDDCVEVELLPPKGERANDVGVYFDGGSAVSLQTGDRVAISKSPRVTKICKLSDVGFLEILHRKMNNE